jgi:hypothetical protein
MTEAEVANLRQKVDELPPVSVPARQYNMMCAILVGLVIKGGSDSLELTKADCEKVDLYDLAVYMHGDYLKAGIKLRD